MTEICRNAQKAEFAQRIAQINDPRNTEYVDPETNMLIPKKMGRKTVQIGAFGRMGYPLSLAMALFSGVFAVMAIRFARFHFLGYNDLEMNADMMFGMDVVMGMGIVLFFRETFNLKLLSHMALLGTSLMGAVLGLHNLVWMYPAKFGSVFSPEWVAMTKAMAEPNSVLFRGVVYLI